MQTKKFPTNRCWNFVFNSSIAFKQKLPDSLNKINRFDETIIVIKQEQWRSKWQNIINLIITKL